MRALVPLSELISDYPEDDPQHGDALLEHGFSGLSDIAGEVLRHLLAAVRAHDRPAIVSPAAALAALDGSSEQTLFPAWGYWKVHALDESKRLVLVPSKVGTLTQSVTRARKVPPIEQIRTETPVPEGGSYLVLYGGGPKILTAPDSEGRTAADDLAVLWAELPVADVLFWTAPGGTSPTLWSVLAGVGDRGGERIEFPDERALHVIRGEDPTNRDQGGPR